MIAKLPSPLAVLLATSNEPCISVSITNPLLADVSVGSTNTWNADVDVADCALPAVKKSVRPARVAANTKRRMIPPLERKHPDFTSSQRALQADPLRPTAPHRPRDVVAGAGLRAYARCVPG